MWLNLETLEWHEPCMIQITTDSDGKVTMFLFYEILFRSFVEFFSQVR